MKKIATLIVKARKIILILFVGVLIFCFWGMTQVEVEYDITTYLPSSTDTRQALDIMDEEFTTYGTATMMIKNISYQKALSYHDIIEKYEGIKEFEFSNTEEYYSQSCALFKITFDGDEEDETSCAAYYRIVDLLSGEDLYISSSLVDTSADDLQAEINMVLVLAVVIIVIVLLSTTDSYALVIVFLLTFGVAALLNMGTNFIFGTISYISNSVCVILQLALAIDYAIILCDRFAEEKRLNGGKAEPALIEALSKAIIEISSSSLTTISGLLALCTMTLGLGADLGLVLAKSILCSMFAVFLFMPAMLIIFNKPVEKTTHKNHVPRISAVGICDVKLRYVLAAVFFAAFSICAYVSQLVSYTYTENNIDTSRPTSVQTAIAEIESVFGYSTQFVIVVPGHDYDNQRDILSAVEQYEEITSATGICNQEVTNNGITYYITDKISYREFAALFAVSDSVADEIYTAYTLLSQDDSKDSLTEYAIYYANKSAYKVSLLQLIDCAIDNDDFIVAYLGNDEDLLDTYTDIRDTITDAEAQLIGENYCRIVFEMNLPTESKETFAFIDTLVFEVKGEYPDIIFAGDSMSAYDLDRSFTTDNLMVNILTVLFVFVILVFTFKSWGVPVPLTLAIQGAIFINFSYYVIAGTNVFFFVYLLVSAIQMGATIDYAIVITNRFEALKKEMNKKQAIIEAINQAFPTVLTSGTILSVAGLLIGLLVTNQLIATLGMCLFRGVLISALTVLTVLPALLYMFEKPLSRTYFKLTAFEKAAAYFKKLKAGKNRCRASEAVLNGGLVPSVEQERSDGDEKK